VRQASTTNYETASSSVTVQVGLATPTFDRVDPITKEFGDSTFLFNWGTSPSDGAITYSSSNPNAATINATTGRVTIVSTGVTTLTMSQDKGTNHTAASISAILTVGRGSPVYGDFVIPTKNLGAAPFSLSLPSTTSSGAFSFRSSDLLVATVDTYGVVTVVGAGSTTITASQAATSNNTGASISTTFVVNLASPTLGSFVTTPRTLGGPTFTLTAPTTNSNGAITYTSSNASVATVDATTGVVTLTGVGSTTITAWQAATSNYTSASTSTTLTVQASVAQQRGTFTTSDLNDFYFDLVAGTTFTVRTYALGIDSQLWLYNSNGTEVAMNDDYQWPGSIYYLDSYFSYTVPTSGRYRLRTGMYTYPFDPNYWSGPASYTVETNS
jgi:hypothetical protein